MENSQLVPLFAEVDVLIVGGASYAVSLALACAAHGQSAYLTCSRPYLGEDIAGEMRYWPEGRVPTGSLSAAVYDAGVKPITPMHAKLTLEQSMVAAGIPFLLNLFPAGVLADGDGEVGGVCFVSRSGPIAIRARRVVDVTREGAVIELSGRSRPYAFQGPTRVLHTTLCEEKATDARRVDIHARPAAISGGSGKNAYLLSARTYALEVDFGEGRLRDLAGAEADIVERCWVPGEYLHQEGLRPDPGEIETEKDRPDLSERLIAYTPAVLGGIWKRHPIEIMDASEKLAVDISLPKRLADLSIRMAKAEPLRESLRTVHDSFRERETAPERFRFPSQALPKLDAADVLVLGGGTAGAPAAIGAARAGADTMLVEVTDQLGGVGTAGQIANYWCGNRVGFTAEVDREVAGLETDPELRAADGNWSVAAKSEWYHRENTRLGVTLVFRSLCAGVLMDGNAIRGLLVATPGKFGVIRAGGVVDASGCGDAAAAAGAPVRWIGGGHVAVQGAGLAGMRPGRDYHNSDHNFFDDTDLVGVTAALVSAKLKFKDDFDAGQLIDTRERRQILGELELDPADFLAERRYPDTVCVASSNFDSHGYTVHPIFMLKPPDKEPLWADVPLRVLLPKGVDRLLATGLGVSCHRDALPVIRMQADVQNQGYAAGRIAALSARNNLPLREINLKDLQRHLVEIGSLPARVLTDEDTFPVPEEWLTEAAWSSLDTFADLALLLRAPERSCPGLRARLEVEGDPELRLKTAELLALMDEPAGRGVLAQAVAQTEWDEGWNYRGMHQFGRSLSPVDVRVICLGRVGEASDWTPVLEKVRALTQEHAFSHFRAVVEACEPLHARHPNPAAGTELGRLLDLPDLTGHAQRSLQEMQRAQNEDPNDNRPRNLSLRELHVARGVFRCGDPDDRGRRVLEAYADDLRGVYARHARAVLAERS